MRFHSTFRLTRPRTLRTPTGSSGGIRGGVTVSTLDSESRGTGPRPGREHSAVLLGKTLFSHSASLHPFVEMGTGEFNAGGNHEVN